MDDIEKRFSEIVWPYGEGDPAALAELEDRIARTGRAGKMLTYSDLARGVPFDIANLSESPRVIDVTDWQDLDRAIIGDFLGVISMRSYDKGGFFPSALVVTAYDGTPGDGFYALMKDLGLITKLSSEKGLDLWGENVNTAYAWYARHA